MTENKPITLEELLKKLSEKLSITIEELRTDYESTFNEVKNNEMYKNATQAQLETVARNKFALRKQREMSSNAVPWEGTIIGVGRLIDGVAKQKLITNAAFTADPGKTMKGCMYADRLVLSDPNGVPLYPKTPGNDKMGRSGKKLPEHDWMRSLTLVVRPLSVKTKQWGPIQPANMTIRNQMAVGATSLPLMKPIKFKALDKTTDEDRKIGEYRINGSAFTKFERCTIEGFPEVESILRGLTNHFKTLGELEEWHNKHSEEFGAWVVTEGNVNMMNLEPNPKTGNTYIILSDESLMFTGNQDSVFCWIPQNRGIEVDFGQESRVLIVGSTSRGKARDPVTKEELEGVPGDIMLNALGIFAPEIFKVKPDVLPLTEASLAPAEIKNW